MTKKKQFMRNEITIICKNLVMTHDDRKKRLKLLKYERDSLCGSLSGVTITDMPMAPHSGISNPVSNIYLKIEELDECITDEQRRVNAVERAINKLGSIEDDPEIRRQIVKGILDNIKDGGIPFAYVTFPDKYDRNYFYEQRRDFLREIGRNLHLLPKR